MNQEKELKEDEKRINEGLKIKAEKGVGDLSVSGENESLRGSQERRNSSHFGPKLNSYYFLIFLVFTCFTISCIVLFTYKIKSHDVSLQENLSIKNEEKHEDINIRKADITGSIEFLQTKNKNNLTKKFSFINEYVHKNGKNFLINFKLENILPAKNYTGVEEISVFAHPSQKKEYLSEKTKHKLSRNLKEIKSKAIERDFNLLFKKETNGTSIVSSEILHKFVEDDYSKRETKQSMIKKCSCSTEDVPNLRERFLIKVLSKNCKQAEKYQLDKNQVSTKTPEIFCFNYSETILNYILGCFVCVSLFLTLFISVRFILKKKKNGVTDLVNQEQIKQLVTDATSKDIHLNKKDIHIEENTQITISLLDNISRNRKNDNLKQSMQREVNIRDLKKILSSNKVEKHITNRNSCDEQTGCLIGSETTPEFTLSRGKNLVEKNGETIDLDKLDFSGVVNTSQEPAQTKEQKVYVPETKNSDTDKIDNSKGSDSSNEQTGGLIGSETTKEITLCKGRKSVENNGETTDTVEIDISSVVNDSQETFQMNVQEENEGSDTDKIENNAYNRDGCDQQTGSFSGSETTQELTLSKETSSVEDNGETINFDPTDIFSVVNDSQEPTQVNYQKVYLPEVRQESDTDEIEKSTYDRDGCDELTGGLGSAEKTQEFILRKETNSVKNKGETINFNPTDIASVVYDSQEPTQMNENKVIQDTKKELKTLETENQVKDKNSFEKTEGCFNLENSEEINSLEDRSPVKVDNEIIGYASDDINRNFKNDNPQESKKMIIQKKSAASEDKSNTVERENKGDVRNSSEEVIGGRIATGQIKELNNGFNTDSFKKEEEISKFVLRNNTGNEHEYRVFTNGNESKKGNDKEFSPISGKMSAEMHGKSDESLSQNITRRSKRKRDINSKSSAEVAELPTRLDTLKVEETAAARDLIAGPPQNIDVISLEQGDFSFRYISDKNSSFTIQFSTERELRAGKKDKCLKYSLKMKKKLANPSRTEI